MPYVNQRWLGGMLTNFSTVHKRLQRLKELEQIDFDDVAASGLTKKELLVLRREKDKLAKTLGGIRDMAKVPSAVWIVDTNKEHLAVDEARKLGIPVVAILDTNCDPDVVDYPIPGNDDAIRAVQLLTRVIADAAADGLLKRHSGRTATEQGADADAEPLAEWERELLAGAEADLQQGESAAAPAAVQAEQETPAEVVAADADAQEAAEAADATEVAPAAEAAVEPEADAADGAATAQ
jgi:small subunit ribosomal protein S2